VGVRPTDQHGHRRDDLTRRWGTAALALVVCLAALAYSNTFSSSFHFDDDVNILKNPAIRDLSRFLDTSGTRYVGDLSFALNYRVGRFDVFGYHLVNLAIHLANGVLVFSVASLVFRTPFAVGQRLPGATGATSPPAAWVALLAAALFLLHPAQTQAVTYIVQRYTSLVALFYLLAVACYLRWRLAEPVGRLRHAWYAAALVSTVLAMKTKENSFTLPLMLIVVEAAMFRSTTWRRWVPLVPFLATLPMIPLSFNAGIEQAGLGIARETLAIERRSYLLTQFLVIVTYLRLLLLPVRQNLDHDVPVVHSFWDPTVVASFLGLLALGCVGVYLLVRSPRFRLVGFGIVWFFLALSVESSIIPIRDVLFEHRLYLPSVGIILAGSVVFVDVVGRRPLVACLVGVLMVGMLTAATYRRNAVWKNDVTLWTDVVAKSPNKARPHDNLANAYAEAGRLDDALAEYLIALRLDPGSSETHNDLGVAYAKQGRLDDAIREYAEALRLQPNDPRVHFNLGNAYLRLDRPDDAIGEYEIALQLDPEFPDIHNNLGNAYLRQGKVDDAINEYRIALTTDPENAEIHTNLGAAYAKLTRLDDAIAEYRVALRFNPNVPDTHYNLGVAYARQQRQQAAIEAYRAALALDPTLVKAHFNLGHVYRQLGDVGAAERHFQSAIRVNPNFVPARDALSALRQESAPVR
jgi:tetratricopeptide (TPR) repeat protein